MRRNKDLVRDLLLKLEDVVLGQQIDEIQLDYEYRSKLARHRPNVQSIWVKLVMSDKNFVAVSEKDVPKLPTNYYEDDFDIKGFVTSFRIGKEAKFPEIFEAAWAFWELNEDKYILTDEYFNDLILYDETISIFYHSYEPLNPENLAMIYMVGRNKKVNLDKMKNSQKTQISVNLDDSKNKFNVGKIKQALSGLKYEKPPRKKNIKYFQKFGNPEKYSNNPYFFLLLLVFLIVNLISFFTHYSLSSSYWLSKINESYYSRPYNDTNSVEVRYSNISTLEDVEQYISKPLVNQKYIYYSSIFWREFYKR